MSIDKYAGHGLGAASLLYRNRADLYPEFIGRDLLGQNPDTRFALLAEDGQHSPDLEATVQSIANPSRDKLPVLITMTIGGNDLLQWWAEGVRSAHATATAFEAFSHRLDRIFERLRTIFDPVRILLGNVYDPTDGGGRLQSGVNVEAGLHLLNAMNEMLTSIATRNGATLIDIHRHFLGHGMRHRDTSYAHYQTDDPSGWYTLDIEPNARGSSEIRRLFWNALA